MSIQQCVIRCIQENIDKYLNKEAEINRMIGKGGLGYHCDRGINGGKVKMVIDDIEVDIDTNEEVDFENEVKKIEETKELLREQLKNKISIDDDIYKDIENVEEVMKLLELSRGELLDKINSESPIEKIDKLNKILEVIPLGDTIDDFLKAKDRENNIIDNFFKNNKVSTMSEYKFKTIHNLQSRDDIIESINQVNEFEKEIKGDSGTYTKMKLKYLENDRKKYYEYMDKLYEEQNKRDNTIIGVNIPHFIKDGNEWVKNPKYPDDATFVNKLFDYGINEYISNKGANYAEAYRRKQEYEEIQSKKANEEEKRKKKNEKDRLRRQKKNEEAEAEAKRKRDAEEFRIKYPDTKDIPNLIQTIRGIDDITEHWELVDNTTPNGIKNIISSKGTLNRNNIDKLIDYVGGRHLRGGEAFEYVVQMLENKVKTLTDDKSTLTNSLFNPKYINSERAKSLPYDFYQDGTDIEVKNYVDYPEKELNKGIPLQVSKFGSREFTPLFTKEGGKVKLYNIIDNENGDFVNSNNDKNLLVLFNTPKGIYSYNPLSNIGDIEFIDAGTSKPNGKGKKLYKINLKFNTQEFLGKPCYIIPNNKLNKNPI
jgi:hypothetical protein